MLGRDRRSLIAVVVIVAVAAACGDDTRTTPIDGATGDTLTVDDTASDRDRLITTYRAYLGAPATTCELWTSFDPSTRATFLTLTARLRGSLLPDGTTMLSHATKMYRVIGGDGATATDPGSCGGGDANRIFVAVDPALHAELVFTNSGGTPITDIPVGSVWGRSNDPGGPHAPFTASDETEKGAPRGQVHYFADPASPDATAPLGRPNLVDLVEPYALEMDQDFDCVHASNPLCDYTYYGPACAPMTTTIGTDIYRATYGEFDPDWKPAGC